MILRHCEFHDRVFGALALGSALSDDAAAFSLPLHDADPELPLKVLFVAAHPDDESECAASLFRMTREGGSIVDQLIVTNGQGGHRYSALAEIYYGVDLCGDGCGDSLTRVRREETLRSARILGVRNTRFLNQCDPGPTLDIHDAFHVWDLKAIRRELIAQIGRHQYDVVLMLLPAPGTHGHHQAVAALVLEAIASLQLKDRPAAIGVQTAHTVFTGVEGFPDIQTERSTPDLSFDRRTRLTAAGENAMDYTIVANWVIAEHKSQGFFQMEYGRRLYEHFWRFQVGRHSNPYNTDLRWNRFLDALGAPFAREVAYA